MGRISRNNGQDRTMEQRHIYSMLRNIEEYELIKEKKHSGFKTVEEFYNTRRVCKQNFLKYYRRYINNFRQIEALIPRKAGRKYRDSLGYEPEILEKIKGIRNKGYNRYDIAAILKRQKVIELSASTVYRLTKKLGLNRLNPRIKEEKRRIIKMRAGELGHIDIHYVAKGTVKETETGDKKLYILGLLDDYSRVCWLEVMDSIKAIDVMFAGMELLLRMKERYDITFEEIMSDNGSEFTAHTQLADKSDHPFEKLLKFYNIKHRYIQAYRPQTNGKIERFWKTLEEELLSGETFETLDEFKEFVLGYAIYYSEHRLHQGINNQIPKNIINTINNETTKRKIH